MSLLTFLTPRRVKMLVVAVPMAIGASYSACSPPTATSAFPWRACVLLGRRRRRAGRRGRRGVAAVQRLRLGQPGHLLRARLHAVDEPAEETRRAARPARALRGPAARPAVSALGWASQEYFLDYYCSRVSVTIDEHSSALVVQAEAFDPEFAFRPNSAILEEAERFVNEYSHRIARENLRFAEGEFGRAGERLQKAKVDLLAFQNKHKLLDPMALARGQRRRHGRAAGADHEDRDRNAQPAEFPQRRRAAGGGCARSLKSLHEQIDVERRRGTSGDNDKRSDRLNELAIEFKSLEFQAEVAPTRTRRAGCSRGVAHRIDAPVEDFGRSSSRQPNPNAPSIPRRWYNFADAVGGLPPPGGGATRDRRSRNTRTDAMTCHLLRATRRGSRWRPSVRRPGRCSVGAVCAQRRRRPPLSVRSRTFSAIGDAVPPPVSALPVAASASAPAAAVALADKPVTLPNFTQLPLPPDPALAQAHRLRLPAVRRALRHGPVRGFNRTT